MRKHRFATILPWLELLFAAGLGLVLYFPLHQQDLGEVAWVVAATVGLARLGQSVEIRNELGPIRDLAEFRGFRDQQHDQAVRELIDIHDKIVEPELRVLRDEILMDATKQLRPLADGMTSDLLAPEYFYEWLSTMLQSVDRRDRVRAVTTMLETEWTNSPAEKKFLQANIEASRRGALIERIFVVREARLPAFGSLEVAAAHSNRRNQRLKGFIVTMEALEVAVPDLPMRLGEGFIVFGERAALIDVTVPPSRAQGLISLDPARVRELVRAFDQTKLHTSELSAR